VTFLGHNVQNNAKSQYVQHDEVGNTLTTIAMYTVKQSLTIECHILRLPQFTLLS